MGFAAFTFFVIFLLIASGGLLLFYREAMLQRISAVVTPRAETSRRTVQQAAETGLRSAAWWSSFERVLPKSQAEVSVAQQRLIRAGYRNDSAVNIFYGAKVLVPLSLCLLVMLSGVVELLTHSCLCHSAGAGISGAGFLAGEKDREAAEAYSARPAGCARSAGDLHGGRPEPGPGDGAHRRRTEPGAARNQR